MSPHDKDTNGKDTFEQDLQQVEAAYRQSAQDEPPALLDQAILNKAKRAIDKPAARPWSFGWIHATATTVLLVLGLTLVNQQRDQMGNIPETLDQLKQSAPVPSSTAPAGAELQDTAGFRENAATEIFSSPADRRAEVAKAAAESETDQPDAGQLSRQIVSELREADPSIPELHKAKPEDNSPIPVVVIRDQERAEQLGLRKPDQSQSVSSSPEYSVEPRVQGDAIEAPDRADVGQASNEEIVEEMVAGTDEMQANKLEAVRTRPASAMAPGVATRTTGEVAQEPSKSKDLDFAKRASEDGMETQVDPEQWLQDIHKLKETGSEETWRKELQAFIAIYPDYPVPEDLLEAMTKPPRPE